MCDNEIIERMYEAFYGLDERPFSITPDPRFVFLSARHQDALAHLMYGIGTGGSGGFVQLTGEVGTGKTTLCRLMLEQVPEQTHIALILNPVLEPHELLRAICREFEVPLEEGATGIEALGQGLNRRLLELHAAGARAVLIVDEAQNMSRETLEQVRLLTNLETATDKLLQIILLGQPELRELLSRPSLRQLAQRITARYHLAPLGREETAVYVRHRMQVAGAQQCPFTDAALRLMFRVSGGVPRLINVIADRALMAGYARETMCIGPALVRSAAAEVVVDSGQHGAGRRWTAALALLAVAAVLTISAAAVWSFGNLSEDSAPETQPLWQPLLGEALSTPVWNEAASLFAGVSSIELEEACREGSGSGLACRPLRGNWSMLRRIGRPVMLALEGDEARALLVVAVTDDEAVVRHRGQEFRVPLDVLERQWLGDFRLAWPDSGEVYERGDRSELVRSLKQLAASAVVQPWDGPVDAEYSTEFSQWVRGFQRRHGLLDDGLSGPVTRLFLRVMSAEEKRDPAGRIIDADTGDG